MRKLTRLALVPLLALCLVGCKDNYGACVKAGADIATGIGQGMQLVDQLRQQGAISTAEESNVLGYLKFANDGDTAFLACVQQVHLATTKATAYTGCAQTFNSALNNPQETALIHVGNAQAQATISNVVQGVVTGINLVITGLGGK